MISHTYKCIFIHIPKCAGTSIEKALGHLDSHVGREGQDHRSIRMIEQPLVNAEIFSSSENLKEVVRRIRSRLPRKGNPRNMATVSPVEYQEYFKFTFVRNPWARTYSWYKNVLRDPQHQKNLNLSKDISFEDFVRSFAGKGMLRPQTYWLKNFAGELPFDFIGRFENLESDFTKICSALNIHNVTLPHEIRSASSRSYHSIYSQELIDIIGNIYQEEIEMFSYSFESG